MTRLQFWTLTGTVGVLCLLFVIQTYIGIRVQSSSVQLNRVEQLINQGRESEVRLRQIATRTYQLSQDDQSLKNLLTRQQITVPATIAPTQIDNNVGSAGRTR